MKVHEAEHFLNAMFLNEKYSYTYIMGCKALINRQTVWLPIANSGLNLGEDQFTYIQIRWVTFALERFVTVSYLI